MFSGAVAELKAICNHNLRSGSYRGKKHIWAKEDAERERQGLPNPYDKFPDEQTKDFVTSRYHEDPITKELTTDPKVTELERLLVRNTSAWLASDDQVNSILINKTIF